MTTTPSPPAAPRPCPFKVGDRIRQVMILDGDRVPQGFEIATVTEITRRGFKWDFGKPKPFIPRWGMSFTGHGETYLDVHADILWDLATEEDERMAAEEGLTNRVAVQSCATMSSAAPPAPEPHADGATVEVTS